VLKRINLGLQAGQLPDHPVHVKAKLGDLIEGKKVLREEGLR
jgi:hypothetical protein